MTFPSTHNFLLTIVRFCSIFSILKYFFFVCMSEVLEQHQLQTPPLVPFSLFLCVFQPQRTNDESCKGNKNDDISSHSHI